MYSPLYSVHERDIFYNVAQFKYPTSISSSPFYHCATRSYLTYTTNTQYLHECRYTIPFSSASFIRKSAALSFTEPPQLRNSALTKISQPECIDKTYKTEYDITTMHYITQTCTDAIKIKNQIQY